MVENNSVYSLACPTFASPWYQRTPRMAAGSSGAIMALKRPPGRAGEESVAGGCGQWRGFFVPVAVARASALFHAALSIGYWATRSGGQSALAVAQRASRV